MKERKEKERQIERKKESNKKNEWNRLLSRIYSNFSLSEERKKEKIGEGKKKEGMKQTAHSL